MSHCFWAARELPLLFAVMTLPPALQPTPILLLPLAFFKRASKPLAVWRSPVLLLKGSYQSNRFRNTRKLKIIGTFQEGVKRLSGGIVGRGHVTGLDDERIIIPLSAS